MTYQVHMSQKYHRDEPMTVEGAEVVVIDDGRLMFKDKDGNLLAVFREWTHFWRVEQAK